MEVSMVSAVLKDKGLYVFYLWVYLFLCYNENPSTLIKLVFIFLELSRLCRRRNIPNLDLGKRAR